MSPGLRYHLLTAVHTTTHSLTLCFLVLQATRSANILLTVCGMDHKQTLVAQAEIVDVVYVAMMIMHAVVAIGWLRFISLCVSPLQKINGSPTGKRRR